MTTATESYPELPQTLAETGLSEEFLVDLTLKILYVHGARSGDQLAGFIKLPFPFVDDQLLSMQQRRLVEVKATQGASRAGYTFDLTTEGRARAREALAMSQYVGPAPVPLSQYRDWVARQTIQQVHVTRKDVEEAFNWLVLNQETLDEVGPAINSGRSLFLFGESGNGKTAIAETIARMLGGAMYVPYAVEIDGQIMVVYDQLHHRPVAKGGDTAGEGIWRESVGHDQRWVLVARPVVFTGGELILDQLDLQWDPDTKVYQAPFQVKANGGVLIIDDFGRQRVPPRDLLNRWIVPLEKRVDFLTLHTGTKFPVPFDTLLVIATNIDPKQLVEEAFLRRIHYKIRVESPTLEQYSAIFSRYCEEKGIKYDPAAVRQLYQNFYHAHSIAPRGCHPRDVIDHLLDIAKYLGIEPELSPDLVDRAGRSYFLDFPTAV
ncbi:MAG: putative ATPase [Gemmatimonadetes bacterium]|nr:putative ATPase [Gemmatimonadota bacterium]